MNHKVLIMNFVVSTYSKVASHVGFFFFFFLNIYIYIFLRGLIMCHDVKDGDSNFVWHGSKACGATLCGENKIMRHFVVKVKL